MKDSTVLLLRIIKIIGFIVSLGLVVYGQSSVGHFPLILQLVGLAGLLFLLWDYNRKYV